MSKNTAMYENHSDASVCVLFAVTVCRYVINGPCISMCILSMCHVQFRVY